MITDWPNLPYLQFEFEVKPKNGISKVITFACTEEEAQIKIIGMGYEIISNRMSVIDALIKAMNEKK